MRAVARVVAQADDAGVTRLTGLRSEPPLLLRHTPAITGPATVHLLGGAAGPLGGDDLRLEIVVGEGAALRIVGIAASVALPARSGAMSRMTVEARVAGGGELHWLPEQLVAANGCHHLSLSNVELDGDARLLWREELICGRHGEPPGDVTISTSVTYAGKPLLRQALQIGPAAPHWAGPGVLSGAKATGCLLGVNIASRLASTPANPAETAVRMPLGTGPAWLVTATAMGAPALRSALTPVSATHTTSITTPALRQESSTMHR